MENLSSPQIDNEISFDSTLRPSRWEEYVGQEKIKRNIKTILEAAKKRGEKNCEHILLCGNSGLGKTTLARLISGEMGSNMRTTSGPAIERAGDLAAILTNLNDGDILFIDEIHRMSRSCEEAIYPAMEDGHLNLILGRGPMARTMDLKLSKFSLVGATTKLSLLSPPFRGRFGAIFHLNFYTNEDIEKIIKRSSKILGLNIETDALKLVASRSRLNPRTANRTLKRVRDFAQVNNASKITKELAEKALNEFEIDNLGLESYDRKLLKILIEKFNGGPVGIHSLSAASGEDKSAIEDVYEPYLLQIGLIERTPKGRIATSKAYNHIKQLNS